MRENPVCHWLATFKAKGCKSSRRARACVVVASKQNAIYRIGDIDRVPESAGVYVFARRHGRKIVPLYIGETTNLRKRLEQHFNDVKIMKGIENAPRGQRVFLYAQAKTKQAQKIERVLDILQRALVEHALSGGHNLLNVQLTETKVHMMDFEGNRTSEKLFTRKMLSQESRQRLRTRHS